MKRSSAISGLATGTCSDDNLIGGGSICMLGFFGGGADGIILGVDATGPKITQHRI